MWEYRIEKSTNVWAINTKEFHDRLNALGNEDWELTALDQFGNLFFKRPKIPPDADKER
jgi:hypothetical protein